MSLTIIIFVALTILSGLIGYLHGVDSGVRRTRRLFERYLSSPQSFTELPPAHTDAKSQPELSAAQSRRSRRGLTKPAAIQGIFGKN